MKTLILCVDRDDDLGRKAGVRGPLIGREENLNAAISLALADPEDSDANAIFAAISLYDRLKKEGKDVEVSTLTGSENVGMKSDEIVAKQLDEVIEKVSPDDIIFVSDGSEDEFILPIITSRKPVKHIRKVIVKQAKNIESTYYIIVRALQDKKIARKILMPIALIFLAYAVASLLILMIRLTNPSWNFIDPGTLALTVITLTLGVYFLERAYGVGEKLRALEKRARTAMTEAKITIVADVLAALIMLAGLDFAYEASLSSEDIIKKMLLFLHTFILWFVFGVIVHEGGRTFDIWVHRGRYKRSFWIALLSTMALGIVVYSALDYILLLMKVVSTTSFIPITILAVSGVIIATLAAFLHVKIRDEENEEIENADEELAENLSGD